MRRATCLAIASASITLGVAQPALGQLGVETSGDRNRETPAKYAHRDFALFTRCVVSRRYERARSLVLRPYGSAEQMEAASKVVRNSDDACLNGGIDSIRMTVRPDVLTGGLAQALVLKDYPDLPSVIGAIEMDLAAEREQTARLTATERFGRCLVWRDPASVQALLQAVPASNAAKQAVEMLKDDMGMCLVEGSTLRINELFLRNVTGVAAYRLAQQLRPRGGGPDGGLVQGHQQKRSANA